ncbi:MAG: hypothetical protein AB7V45_02160 [Candidatus Krumholzibacteriia bacterium]
MKKLILATALVAMAIGGSAFAQLNWEDNIGLYFDEGATSYCGTAPIGFTHAFLVLTHCTSPSVGGWEAKVTFEGGVTQTAAALYGLTINAATRPNEFIVGLGQPLVAVNGSVVLADFTLYATGGPGYGFVGPVYFDSLQNNLPAYLDGNDPELVKPMLPSLGGIFDPVLIVNGDCGPVENEDASFGGVKALFR